MGIAYVRGGALMLRYWCDIVGGGDGSSGRREWVFRLAERSEKNQGKGIDTRRAENFMASWIDLES